MAEFMTVMNEYYRMCAKNIRCDSCPLSSINNGNNGVSCQMSVCKSPKIAERIIMQWSAEHPIMTNGEKFKEVFGKDLLKFCAETETPWGDIVKWLNEEYQETK